MVGKRIPLFNRGNILTKEMLDALKDYAVRSSELAYVGYSDGILKGCNITTKDNLITINKGILIFNETAYYIHEPISILSNFIVCSSPIKAKCVSQYTLYV